MGRWLERRTGLLSFFRSVVDESIPGGPRWSYVFGSGLLFLVATQFITGIALALYYVPSTNSAHTTVAYITKQVWSGSFIRSVHSYGSQMIVVVLFLHLTQTFLFGAFKGRREILWLSGVCLFFLMLGMAFTGYLLPWDQRAYFATAVGTSVMGEVPVVGVFLKRLLRGGDEMGTLTLSRFYVLHIIVIPFGIAAFIALHLILFRKAGPAGPPEPAPRLSARPFYPRQFAMDAGFAGMLMLILIALAHFAPVPLGPEVDCASAAYIPRPEWYFLPLFQWLKYWTGSRAIIGIVVIPTVVFALFALVPFVDRGPERRPRRRLLSTGIFACVIGSLCLLGFLSRRDDRRDRHVSGQIARQNEEERNYMRQPFEPTFTDVLASAKEPSSPLLLAGQGIFHTSQCVFCHGEGGIGTKAAPRLAGLASKLSVEQLSALIRHPNPKMKAGGMPAFAGSDADLHSLIAYLQSL